MEIKKIKNDRNYFWTNHVKYKMLQYGLSPAMVKKVLRRPERKEIGVAPETDAVMMRKDSKKNKKELWVMTQNKAQSKRRKAENERKFTGVKIISAWIYPGVSPKGKNIYIPEDAWAEL